VIQKETQSPFLDSFQF